MNDATSKPVDIRKDLGELRRAAASTVSDGGVLVRESVRQGVDAAGDRLNELRDQAVRMGIRGATAVRESGEAVAEHPVVFGTAAAAIAAAGWAAGRNQDEIVGAAHKLVDRDKQIPGERIARDAGLVALGAVVSAAIQHAAKDKA